ncbi:MAG: HEAT repeat domain-containing protein [bacterium]|nr:HEAT repeat domain-containing protein [bacterium]
MKYLQYLLLIAIVLFFFNNCSTQAGNEKNTEKPGLKKAAPAKNAKNTAVELPPGITSAHKFHKIKTYLDAFRGKRFLMHGSRDNYPLVKDPEAVPIYIHFLGDTDWAVKAKAATALGKSGDKRAFEPLLKVLRARRNNASGTAATALGQLGDPRAGKHLLDALAKSSNDFLRLGAVSGLGKLKPPEALPRLLSLLKSPNKTMRNNAAFAIAGYKDPSAFDDLKKALEIETENSIKYAYVKAIEESGHPESVPYFCGLLQDPSEDVKRSVAFALSGLKDSRAIPAFEKAVAQEKDKEIKSLYAHFAKGLKEDARQGELKSINGKPTPRVVAPIGEGDRYAARYAPRSGTGVQTVRVRDEPVLIMNRRPAQITHYVEPLAPGKLTAHYFTDTHLFLAYTSHLDVFSRDTLAGRIFTYPDGYRGFKHRCALCTDFRDYIAFSDDPDDRSTSAAVRDFYTVYDKQKQTLFELSAAEFNEASKKWQPAQAYKERKTGLMAEHIEPRRGYKQKDFYYVDPETGHKSFLFQGKQDYISDIAVYDGRLYAFGDKGFRRIDRHGTHMDEGAAPGGRILQVGKNKSLGISQNEIRLYHHEKPLKIIPPDNYEQTFVGMDDKYSYYRTGYFGFKAVSFQKEESVDVFKASFLEAVTKIAIHEGRLFIVTVVGVSVFNPATLRLENYFNNPLMTKGNEDWIHGDYSVGGNSYYIGRRGRRLLFHISNYGYSGKKTPPQLAAYDLDTFSMVTATEDIIPPKVAEFLLAQSAPSKRRYGGPKLEGDFLVDEKVCKIFRFAPGLPLVRDYNYSTAPSDVLRPNIFNAAVPYPIGDKTAVKVTADTLWILTSKGLFFSPLESKEWVYRFQTVPALHGEGLLATAEYVYSFDWDNDDGTRPQCARLDRRTHRLEAIYDNDLFTSAGSPCNDGDSILYAYRECYDFGSGVVRSRTGNGDFRVFPAPGDVFRVVPWVSGKMAAVGEDTVFIMDRDGKVCDTIKLTRRQDRPIFARIRRDVLWLASEGYVIEVRLKTREVREWPVGGSNDPEGIVVGGEDVFLFTGGAIYLKKSAGGGFTNLKNWLKDRNGEYMDIHCVYDYDAHYILLGTEDGVYRFHKTDWLLTPSRIPIDACLSIAVEGDFVFLGTRNRGLFEVNRKYFEKSFYPTTPGGMPPAGLPAGQRAAPLGTPMQVNCKTVALALTARRAH